MEAFQAELVKVLVPAIGTAVSLLITWGLFELRKLIKTKTDNEAAVQAFDVVSDLVQNTVASINQEATKQIESNGKLNPAFAKALKQKANSVVMSQLRGATKKALAKNVRDLEVYVDNRIEAAVYYEKAGGRS